MPDETDRQHTRFNQLVGMLDYPMLIATVAARDGTRAGCLVGFATQCSIDPPRFLICISDKNYTWRVAQDADALAVHFVPAEADALAELFGGETGDEIDKFAQSAWRAGPLGQPILADLDNWFVGVVIERVALGDHVGFVLEPVEVAVGPQDAEFTFHRARSIEPGHRA
jgi:flavin reductase (DIM6/NTAB) family NADH-FMN oxidoreductase RutF